MIKLAHFSNYSKQLCLLMGIAFMISCGGKEKPDANLQKAYETHEKAVKIRNQAGDQLTQLTANVDSLFVITYKNQLDSIGNALKVWDEQLVEVPGFEEEHDHSGHDHNHDHGSQPELTPEQHLEVQQHLLEEIQAIEQKISQIEG